MIEMPERIYAAIYGENDAIPFREWRDRNIAGSTEYIRADLAQPTDDARAIDNLPKLSFYSRGVYEQRKKACIPQRYDHADDALELIENEKLRKSHDARAKALEDVNSPVFIIINRLEDYAAELQKRLWQRKQDGEDPITVNASNDWKRWEETLQEIIDFKAFWKSLQKKVTD